MYQYDVVSIPVGSDRRLRNKLNELSARGWIVVTVIIDIISYPIPQRVQFMIIVKKEIIGVSGVAKAFDHSLRENEEFLFNEGNSD